MKKELTIITITYNNFAELKKTVDSIAKLDVHFLVIDGGHCEISKSYCEKNLVNLTYIKEKDSGISDAYNKGVLQANSEYIMFLNSGDVYLNTNYIDSAITFLNKNPLYSIVHTDIIIDDELAGQIKKSPKLCTIGRGMPAYFPSMIMRRTLFSKTGLFNLDFKIAMDYDWYIRVLKNEILVRYLKSEPAILFDGTGVSSKNEWAGIVECLDSLYKNEIIFHFSGITIAKRISLYFLRRLILLVKLDNLLIEYKKNHFKHLKIDIDSNSDLPISK